MGQLLLPIICETSSRLNLTASPLLALPRLPARPPLPQLSIEPKASGADGHPVRVNPSLHVADLPMLAGLSVSSYRSPLPVVFLTGLEGGDTLLRVAGLQDRNVAFQAFIHRLTPGAPLAVVAASAAQHRFDVVLLVHEGPLGAAPKTHAAAFRLLAQLLRAGEDTLHLVYFAQDHSELARAQKVLDGFAPDDNPMLAVTRKVLVTTDSIPVALDNFADAVSAQVVVVAAGTSAGGGVTLGSVAMTVAKRSIFPVLVAKPDLEGRVAAAGARLKAVQDEEVGGRAAAGFLKGGSRDAPGIRVLLGVEVRPLPLVPFPVPGASLSRRLSRLFLRGECACVSRGRLTLLAPPARRPPARRRGRSRWSSSASARCSCGRCSTRSSCAAARAARGRSSSPPATTPRCA